MLSGALHKRLSTNFHTVPIQCSSNSKTDRNSNCELSAVDHTSKQSYYVWGTCTGSESVTQTAIYRPLCSG